MDLGIAGRRAIVCASSKGLGRACAEALVREGVEVTLNGRDRATLNAAAQAIRAATGVAVHAVAGDITAEATRAALIARCPEPDILINNAGGPPPGDFRRWSIDDWHRALDANMLAPIAMIALVLDGMVARRWGRIVNITSGAVKAPIATLGLSNGARAGLTGFVAGLARQVAAKGVTINNLLPGPFETDRLRANIAARAKEGESYDAAAGRERAAIPAGRFGAPDEFGAACAFLCGSHAGFITGQNLLLDGGKFPGTL